MKPFQVNIMRLTNQKSFMKGFYSVLFYSIFFWELNLIRHCHFGAPFLWHLKFTDSVKLISILSLASKILQRQMVGITQKGTRVAQVSQIQLFCKHQALFHLIDESGALTSADSCPFYPTICHTHIPGERERGRVLPASLLSQRNERHFLVAQKRWVSPAVEHPLLQFFFFFFWVPKKPLTIANRTN